MNYYTKLCELEKQLKMQKERLEEVHERIRKLIELRSENVSLIFDANYLSLLSRARELEIMMMLEIEKTRNEIRQVRSEYAEYAKEHSNDFYGLTDDIDIVMTIHKDGSIHGSIL